MFTAAAAPGHDPVELRALCAADADRDDDVRAERDGREGERADDARRLGERRRRDPVDDPRRQEREPGRDPGGQRDEIREHVGVRAPRLAVVVDRVRERGPRERNAVSSSTIAEAMRTPTE